MQQNPYIIKTRQPYASFQCGEVKKFNPLARMFFVVWTTSQGDEWNQEGEEVPQDPNSTPLNLEKEKEINMYRF